MEYRKLMSWAAKLTLLAVVVALISGAYIFGESSPATADSNRVVYVAPDWSLKPADIGLGERFRLIFLAPDAPDFQEAGELKGDDLAKALRVLGLQTTT